MNLRFLHHAVIGLAVIFMSTACATKATPPVNDMATNIAQGVSIMLTRTALAPTLTPSATPTQTPVLPPLLRRKDRSNRLSL